MATHLLQGVYSPLPQSLSESDSEKEMSIDLPTTKRPAWQLQNGCNGNCEFSNSQQNGYTLAAGMNSTLVKKAPLSPARKFWIVMSTLFCVLIVIIFLWVLPCSTGSTCPVKVSSWENQHDDIELTGKINVVQSAFKHSSNLVLLFKYNLNSDDRQSGAISVMGNSGAVAWCIQQARIPIDLNCYLIDVNDDGITDCLLLGEIGLEAIDPVSGIIFWHVHSHYHDKALSSLDFPTVLSDVNGDRVPELLTVGSWNSHHSMLVLICGKTGLILGKTNITHCLESHIVSNQESNIIYSCKKKTGLDFFLIPVEELNRDFFDKTIPFKTIKVNFSNPSDDAYVLNERKLTVDNIGTCPHSCRTHIGLYDTRNNKEIFWLTYLNSYAMKPTTFSFKSTKGNIVALKGHINGFILKLWQWFNYNPKNKKLKDNFEGGGHFNSKVKRTIILNNKTIQINSIMERVVLITFNDTNVHVINASLTEITQLCFPVSGSSSYNCQPDLLYQNNSLLINDLDRDGSQELVSYSSTFINKEDPYSLKPNWKLVSNMKVIRLEAELPKLYEVTK